jgi:hypothetical protein
MAVAAIAVVEVVVVAAATVEAAVMEAAVVADITAAAAADITAAVVVDGMAERPAQGDGMVARAAHTAPGRMWPVVEIKAPGRMAQGWALEAPRMPISPMTMACTGITTIISGVPTIILRKTTKTTKTTLSRRTLRSALPTLRMPGGISPARRP